MIIKFACTVYDMYKTNFSICNAIYVQYTNAHGYHVSKSGSFIRSSYFHAEIQQFFINAHSSTNVWNSSMKDQFWLSWKTDVGNGYTFCDAQFHCLILSDDLKT